MKPDLHQDTSEPHLVALPSLPFPVLLVGRSVATTTTMATTPITTMIATPTVTTTTSTLTSTPATTPVTTTQTKETQELKAKNNLSLSTLSNKKEFF